MKGLKELRDRIDALDERLVPLLAERLELADAAAAERRAAGLPVSDPVREREILTALSGRVDGDCARAVRLVYTTLFGVSKARQRVKARAFAAKQMLIVARGEAPARTMPSRDLSSAAGLRVARTKSTM